MMFGAADEFLHLGHHLISFLMRRLFHYLRTLRCTNPKSASCDWAPNQAPITIPLIMCFQLRQWLLMPKRILDQSNFHCNSLPE